MDRNEEEREQLVASLAPISLHTRNKSISFDEIIMSLEAPPWRQEELTATQAMNELIKMFDTFQRLLDRSVEVVEANLSSFRDYSKESECFYNTDIRDCEDLLQEIKERRPQ